MEGYSIREVNLDGDVVEDPEEQEVLNREIQTTCFYIFTLDIPTGSTLTFLRDETKTVTVMQTVRLNLREIGLLSTK